jgi:hypothetical protein
MFYQRQSQVGLRGLVNPDRIQFLKVGQVIGHLPGKNMVEVLFDGRERAPDSNEETGTKKNTRKIPCKVGQNVSHFTHGVVGLPGQFSWVVVAFIENQEHAPVVLACIDDDFTNILPTLSDDHVKRLWHHWSDSTALIRGDGTVELVHPTGLKAFIGVQGAAGFTQHFRRIRNDDDRRLKGQGPDEESEGEALKYESPDGKWTTGEWNYGPQGFERSPDDYDHRMIEQPREPIVRINHPKTGSDWLDAPAGSGGEYGANYQQTKTYIEWDKDGNFRFHTDDDYYLDIDITNQKVKLSANNSDMFLELNKSSNKVKLSGKSSDNFLEIDVTGKKATLMNKTGTQFLEMDANTDIAKLFSAVFLLLGDDAAQFLWKFPVADTLFNAHFHLGFLGIPTSPPTQPLIPLDGHLTTKVKAT